MTPKKYNCYGLEAKWSQRKGTEGGQGRIPDDPPL